MQPQWDQFRGELKDSPKANTAYREAILKLKELSPQVWLPALPLSGQNANLYDDQWQETLEYNESRIPENPYSISSG